MVHNVEIKARCSDTESVKAYLHRKGARFIGVDRQRDTYFNVPNGRLKLREGDIENALIHYLRQDDAGPKSSHVHLFPVTDGPLLRNLLEAALGVKVVVCKTREIYFLENVKFHVDRVEGLGDFMEIEAIDATGELPEGRLLEQCRMHMEGIGIREKDLLHDSYSDRLFGPEADTSGGTPFTNNETLKL